MDPKVMWTIVVIALVGAGIAGWFVWSRRRTEQLCTCFGSEYDRVVGETQDVRKAEASLAARAKRVERLQIHFLRLDEASQYRAAWQRVQARFVDDPKAAITEADRLVGEVMTARGYPVGDFDQNATDLSVDHPRVVENYRIAHEIALRDYQGQDSTEDLRKAMVSYRALFEELLGENVGRLEEVRR